MYNTRNVLGRFSGSVLIALALILSGCGGGGGDSSSSSNTGGASTTTRSVDSSVAIKASTVEGKAPLEVRFTPKSDDLITSASWKFGDGKSAEPVNPASSVTYTYTENGTYTVTLNATTNLGGSQTEKIQIVVGNGTAPEDSGDSKARDVNLIVKSFAIDTEIDVLNPENLETVSVIIQNKGTKTLKGSGFINVGYYLSEDEKITVDDIFIGDTSILIGDSFAREDVDFGFEKLSPGENYQYNHQLAVKRNIPTGTYYAGAIVDYIDYYEWYTFPRATDTVEYDFPVNAVVNESDEKDNVRLLKAHQVSVTNAACTDDDYDIGGGDDKSKKATLITLGESQDHNFCFDNADWLKFDAVQGGVYKITTSSLGLEADTQIILYDRDRKSILLMDDNIGNDNDEILKDTVDLQADWPPNPESEIVWEAKFTGTYYVKVRVTTCDEDLDTWCDGGSYYDEELDEIINVGDSPDGVGLDTEYTITLQ